MPEFLELIIKLPFGLMFFFITVRLMGKKELAQANALDYAFAVLIASIVWDMSIEGFEIWQIAVVCAIVGTLIFLLDWITAKNIKVEKAVIGEPILLIKDGNVIEEALEEERLSISELNARLRVLGVFDIKEVAVAYLEVSGQISILKKEDTLKGGGDNG